MKNKHPHAAVVLALGLAMAGLHLADLLLWSGADTGFAAAGSVWLRYIPWLAAFALPYLPARRAAAQPAGLQDTNKPLGVCMALAGAALLASGVAAGNAARYAILYPEVLSGSYPVWAAWADLLLPIFAGAWLLNYAVRAFGGFGLQRQRLGSSLLAGAVPLIGWIVLLIWALVRARTERKKADAANAAKTAFLTRMSHDIRTPLNGILGLIEIEELKEGDMQVARESRAKARVAANHLLSLINDILEMGKIEDRKLTLEHAPFNLKELCDDTLVLCKLRASSNGITMQDNSLPYATGPYMIGSPTHIRQVMINLLDNSIKYNKHGGSVTFSSQTKPLDNGRALFCFSVSDTGIGMAPEFLKHIYEPFAQEGDDARSKFQGTGMGMPIVKSLIELMGGTIEVTSELHVGTTFYVEIPLDIDKNPRARANTVERALDCSLADMNVLLAEDNELNAEIAQTLLESEGVVVTRAVNGNEVVDLYLSHPAGSFDAILMDIMMPDMDGYEATRAIRLSEKVDAADIPIIALTANAFAEDAKAAHDAGMNAHLSKPLDFNKLKNILARIKKNGSVSL